MDMGGSKAEDEKLIVCIWDEMLSFQQFGSLLSFSISRNTAAKNYAEVDGLVSDLLVLFKQHFLKEKCWAENLSSRL